MGDLATRSSNLLGDGAGKQRPDQPGRSLIAPVSDPDTGESASLLVALPSKLSAKALAEAQSLESLPPAHQLALRRALIAVTESHKDCSRRKKSQRNNRVRWSYNPPRLTRRWLASEKT